MPIQQSMGTGWIQSTTETRRLGGAAAQVARRRDVSSAGAHADGDLPRCLEQDAPASARKTVWGHVHSRRVLTCVLVVILFDVGCVVAELLISHHDECRVVTLSAPCTIAAILGGSPDRSGCRVGWERHLPHDLHEWEEGIAFASRVALFLLAAEVCLQFFALREYALWYHHGLVVLDAAAVAVAIAADAFLSGRPEAKLIVLSRLIRFGRVIHGVFMLTVEGEAVLSPRARAPGHKRAQGLNASAAARFRGDIRGAVATYIGAVLPLAEYSTVTRDRELRAKLHDLLDESLSTPFINGTPG